jgi:hypothetical protein
MFALLGVVMMTMNVVYPGGLKDLDSDDAAGMHTFLGSLRRAGARRGNPLGLISAVQAVPHAAVLGIAAYAVVFVYDRDPGSTALRLAVLAALTVGRILIFARAIAASSRRKRLGLGAAHEFLAVAFVPVLFGDALPAAYGILLVFAPLAAYVGLNRLVYGTLAAPVV